MESGQVQLSLRERQKAQTREHLLCVATSLIAAKGFAATSIDDIAKAAGSSRATVYSYFDSKDTILAELIRGMWDDANELYREFGALPDWSRPSIHAWVQTVISRNQADAERNRAALEISLAEVIQNEGKHHQLHIGSLTLNSKMWTQRFTKAETRGRASIIITMIEGYTTRLFLHGTISRRGPAVDLLTDAILDMLHARE
ncbi:MAG: putative TetR family transcriptional regulator [Amycolatopsis sp.]|uniref:TetR/AcrR family transcriptional regulator n=1 Tax=Amycolatopsis sp. TaxID=37632 RepID=UPI00261EF6B6|nr:TetR/AcrR family transcriptional regulator [Amycolatopsis sp.]MCU1687410.1 putative TetR family transcriptional regulator [Amycolatopsis sp.]